MDRWHIMDPIRFEKDLKINIHDLGGRYYPQQSNIATVAYWYQRETPCPLPEITRQRQTGAAVLSAINWKLPYL